MAVGEILAKGLVVIKGDTSHARAEVAKLSAEEQKAAKARIKAQEEHNQALERSNQRFQLYAAGAVAGWALVSSGVKKYEEHLKSLGSAGETELAKLNRMTGSLTKAQDSLLIAFGRAAVAAEPLVLELAKMANELASVANGIVDIVEAAKRIPGAGYIGTGVRKAARYGIPVYGQVLAGKDAYDYLSADETVAPGRGFNAMMRRGQLGNLDAESYVRGLVDEYIAPLGTTPAGKPKTTSPRSRGGGRGDSGPGMFDQMNWFIDDMVRQKQYQDMLAADRAKEQQQKFGGLGGIGSQWSSVALPQSALDNLDRTIADLTKEQEGKQDSLLTKIFGPVEEFDMYAAGFDLLKTASQSAFQAWIDGSKGAGQAFKDAAIASLTANATELLGTGLSSIGHGIVHLAMGNPKGPGELAAGAKAIAQAAVIGGLAKQLGGHSSAGSGANAGAGRANSYAAAGLGGSGGSGGDSGGNHYTVVISDPFGLESPRAQAQRVRNGLDLANQRTRGSSSVVYS